jgi:hypothetical protein
MNAPARRHVGLIVSHLFKDTIVVTDLCNTQIEKDLLGFVLYIVRQFLSQG